jgi:hypothetical protein
MMTQQMAVAAGLACILAACSPPARDAEGAANAGGMQPGQYRTTVTMLEIPGIEPQSVDRTPTVTENCVTSSDIANFTGGMAGGNSDDTCTQNSMNTSGGRIQGVSSCTGANGTSTLRINGTYSATRIDMEINSTIDTPGVGAGTMRMNMTSERIGECSAGTATD